MKERCKITKSCISCDKFVCGSNTCSLSGNKTMPFYYCADWQENKSRKYYILAFDDDEFNQVNFNNPKNSLECVKTIQEFNKEK